MLFRWRGRRMNNKLDDAAQRQLGVTVARVQLECARLGETLKCLYLGFADDGRVIAWGRTCDNRSATIDAHHLSEVPGLLVAALQEDTE